VTIAQVQIDEAYWTFTQDPPGPLSHLDTVRLAIPYPWVANETHLVKVLTSNGIPFEHEIAVATKTPRPSWRFFAWFALIGLYVGVIPIAVGLLWYPAIGQMGRRGLDFVLALTLGLLIFLFVDTVEDGLEAANELAQSFQGVVLFTLVALHRAPWSTLPWPRSVWRSWQPAAAGAAPPGRVPARYTPVR
jgi:hypothetical protein